MTGMNFTEARQRMVQEQLLARGISDAAVLRAMQTVPREDFVRAPLRERAYDDTPLPLDEAQSISQPYMVALMAEAAGLAGADRVLEIGTGSGYAAAVASCLASKVYSMERDSSLAASAKKRLSAGGYDNVVVRTGDGTLGWPEQAPFDVILATAGAPSVPSTWLSQLAPGGRLVLPVGPGTREQELLCLTRTGHDDFQESRLGPVRFVPLIGAYGWRAEDDRAAATTPPPAGGSMPDTALITLLRQCAQPLPGMASPDFAAFADRFAGHRVVLLGESTHGSSEFYQARAAITRRLIRRHGFMLVAAEADWPDASVLDDYVRLRPAQGSVPFRRFPSWMWRNRETEQLLHWLREHNSLLSLESRTRIAGLDLYNLNAAMHEVVAWLDKVDPDAAAIARHRYGCLAPWQDNPAAYAREVFLQRYQSCEDDVVTQLTHLLEQQLEHAAEREDGLFNAAQNARLVVSAERYYRSMYQGRSNGWNLRERHMFDTLLQVLAHAPAGARMVVWAHNAHVGDARATERAEAGEVSLGQLCREHFGDAVALVGCGSARGTVAAAREWGGAMQCRTLREPLPDSLEWLAWQTGVPLCFLDLRAGVNPALHAALDTPRLQRMVGVVYRPESERHSHYLHASPSRQFDGYLWCRDTSAVTPLTQGAAPGEADTWPFGE